jgi:hypothetical protein
MYSASSNVTQNRQTVKIKNGLKKLFSSHFNEIVYLCTVEFKVNVHFYTYINAVFNEIL